MSYSEKFSLGDFSNYIKKPYYKIPIKSSFFSNLNYLLRAYLFCLIFIIVSGIFILIIENFLVKQLGVASIYKQIQATNQNVKDYFGSYSFLLVILVVPLIEETIFRLPLNPKSINLAVSIALLSFRLLGNSFMRIEYLEITYWLSIACSIALLLSVYYFIPQSFSEKLKNNYFKYEYYFIAIIFGLVHITNIKTFKIELFFIYPLFVLPQIIMGFFFGYIRMQKGFIWGIALHGLLNTTSFFLR